MPTIFALLFLENYFFFCSHGALNTLPAYLSSLGATKSYIGFFMNINPLILVLSVLFFTPLISKISLKKQLFIGYGLQLVSYIMMFVFSDNLTLMLCFRAFSSFSYVAGFTVNVIIAYSIIPVSKRTAGIAMFGISGILSNPTASYIGEKIFSHFGAPYLFVLGSVFCIIAATGVLFLKAPSREETHSTSSFWSILQRKELWIFMAVSFTLGGAWSILNTFIPNLSKERFHDLYLSYYFIAFSIVAISSRIVYSAFIDKISKKKLILFSLFFMTTAMFLTVFINVPWQFYIVGALYGVAHSILYPLMSAIFVNSGSKEDRTALSNSMIAFYTSGNIIVSTLFGLMGDFFQTSAIFLSMGSFAAGMMVVITVLHFKQLKRARNGVTGF